MRMRELILFLGLQLLAIAIAGASFVLIESRLWAGAVAGGYFVISGLFMVFRAWRWPDKWRLFFWYPLLVHVFGISIPMVTTRFMQAGLSFEQIRIWGLEGPQFHRLSTTVFMILMIATVVDIARTWRATRLPA